MDRKKLDDLASRLLDTGKRNPLNNLNPRSATLAEILLPNYDVLFKKVEGGTKLEVYDPKIVDDEDSIVDDTDTEIEQDMSEYCDDKSRYRAEHAKKIRRQNQILLYHQKHSPTTILKNIDKRAKEFMDGTGVNVAYMTFGMVHWKESESSQIVYRAPLLLVPIRLTQSSSVSAYQIEPVGDDIVVNPTFDQRLEESHSIHLPEYEEESLDSYLEQASVLLKKLSFSVTPDCWIGIFSFQKLNMYRDIIDHQDMILSNPNIQRLLGLTSTSACEEITDSLSAVENPLTELHTVVDADSSQLEAVEMARSGKSFVLKGPPGTGKSQTITNIIAECLYNGKKVLFVAEKQAALSVVFQKLKDAGLSEFCLELHSHKANKKEIISEICHTLNLDRHNVSHKADVETAMKVRVQEQLDTYERELHLVREPLGKSLYDMYGLYASVRQAPDISWYVPEVSKKSDEYLVDTEIVLKQYVSFLPTIGYDYRKNPWYGYQVQDVSQQTRRQVEEDLKTTVSMIQSLLPICYDLENSYGVTCTTLEQALLWRSFFRMAENSTFLTPALLKSDCLEQLQASVEPLQTISTEVLIARKALENFWEPTLYQMQGADLYEKLVREYSGFFSRLFKKEYRELIKNLQLSSKSGKRPSYADAVEVAKQLSLCQAAELKFLEAVQPIEAMLGPGYNGPSTDWESLVQQLQIVHSTMEAGLSFGSMEQYTVETMQREQENFGEFADKLCDCLDGTETIIERITSYFAHDKLCVSTTCCKTLLERLEGCLENMEQLMHWCQFRTLMTQLERHSLLLFIEKIIENNVEPDQIVKVFQKCFYTQWIESVFSDVSVFSLFNRISQDQNVDIFAEKDKKQCEINKAQIRARLSQQRPDTNLVTIGSPVYTLQQQGKKKRQMSIRKLMQETGEVVQEIKPCFLMSPLSVSTFLPPEAITFDTVIFDEASQVFPEDAIGAIYRAKQLIVVGDPKQMPPTNFFKSVVAQVDRNDDENDVADFESILDYCIAVSFPSLSLKWHYRSRYEELIAFSNKNFYLNELITFPSVETKQPDTGVDYCYVNGIYDQSSHTNRKEAEYVVELIYEHTRKYPKRSLGVVAFNSQQQGLIEKLLGKRRESSPEMDAFFRNPSIDTFFIKNLETVQGDERDTIIFSVIYGRNAQGKMLYYFNQLNRNGGERRLNVAVTRARENVKLVSSMHYTDIDLSHSGAEGVRLLREYLDYAENGKDALNRSLSIGSEDRFDSEFERDVCEYLRSKGFSVDTQVGCSGYRIDLALKHPGTSNYVLAIECDGATYHSGKNARDRDRLRQEILEKMGWKFYRIWSTDWFRNRKVEQERLLKATTAAIVGVPQVSVRESVMQQELQSGNTFVEFEETERKSPNKFPIYQTAKIEELKEQLGDDAYQSDAFQKFILEILKIEAPLSENNLLHRIVDLFSSKNVRKPVRDTFAYRMIGCSKNGIVIRDGFLYLEEQTEYVLRIPDPNEIPRPIKEIALEELAAGLRTLIQKNISVEKSGLYRSLTNLCGYNRVGKAIEERLDMAMDLLGDQIQQDGDMVSCFHKMQ